MILIYSQGIRPPPEITVVPLDSVAGTFNTGDIILLSGATNSGAIIKLFDNSQFSHVGIVSHQCHHYYDIMIMYDSILILIQCDQVLKFLHTAQLMIFQSSTNRAGEPMLILVLCLQFLKRSPLLDL